LNKKFGNKKWATYLYERVRFLALQRDVKKFGCDVMHAHTTYPNGYLAAKLSDKTNIPLIITPHGHDIHTIPELDFGQRLNPKLNARICYAVGRAFALTAISENIREALIDADADNKKITMIPNGVDLERFSKKIDSDVKSQLDFPPDAKIIVTVGQFHPRKGHDVLIRAMTDILKQEPLARLVIIGKSDPSLTQLLDELNLNEIVNLTGPIKAPSLTQVDQDSNKQSGQIDYLAAILQNSECYVSSGVSEGSEGLSLAVLDAMASSLPVVASDISGNRDIISEGENGYLIVPGSYEKLAQAILKLLSDDKMRQKMGDQARVVATAYAWSEIAKQYESLYRETIEAAHLKMS
jgi:glycosyltransferase involved in cell wall biosynthesis